MFGPVHDVRIPYQQKRLFGIMTFVYPDTIKIILAEGNPYRVCDLCVLVKPYKEKGKFKEKHFFLTIFIVHETQKQYLQQCLSPSGLDSTPPLVIMLLNSREMMLRKMEHEAEMKQAIELQGRRTPLEFDDCKETTVEADEKRGWKHLSGENIVEVVKEGFLSCRSQVRILVLLRLNQKAKSCTPLVCGIIFHGVVD
ncbi:RNA-binding (RRM/RBD/RNP motifs) family protein, partial [Striga asiatica]